MSDRDHTDGTDGPPDADAPRRRLITRRRMLIGGGALVGAAAVASGGFVLHDQWKRFARDATATVRDHRVQLPVTLPRMVIARGGDPALVVRAAIERLGGMRRFIGRDDVVVIKPNVGWNRTAMQAANTHPEVVAAVVRACREVGPRRLIVSDCPVQDSAAAFELSGIGRAAAEAGAEVLPPERSSYRTVQISRRLGTWDVLAPFVEATKLINVPVAKHHDLTGVTAGMKNWIGITAKLRMTFHGDIQRSIAELAALMRPTLTVVDATRVLMETGPAGGSLSAVKQVGAVAAGVDPVALDAWAFSLFGVLPDELPEYFRLTERAGLGVADFASLGPVEVIAG